MPSESLVGWSVENVGVDISWKALAGRRGGAESIASMG